MAYIVKIKRSTGGWFIASDNVSSIHGVGKTLKKALRDYDKDIQEFLVVCDQDYPKMGYGLQEECHRLRTAVQS